MILIQLCKTIVRTLYTNEARWAVEKSLLARLRKKTGYTFTNCKKALEMHNHDILKAESWLKEQAQQLGWAKATKLEGRQTVQGLIAVAVKNNSGVLLELNCETDFVTRNDLFQSMADTAASTVLKYAETQLSHSPITKIGFDNDQLGQLKAEDGKKLSDHVALMIGRTGENATLKRAMCIKVGDGLFLSGYVHPSTTQKNETLLGRLGGLVALKQIEEKYSDIKTVGKNICQHIVGMNPEKLGTEEDKPSLNADEELCLIHQEYLLDDSLLVKEVLETNGLEVVDFKRFECGETSKVVEQPLEHVETCQ